MAEGGVPVAIVGCTGLLGSAILSKLLSHPSITPVHALARRNLPSSVIAKSLEVHVQADTSTWSAVLPSLQPKPAAFVSALGTTRAVAGGVEAQRKIDFDLNLELAQEAKKANIGAYVLVSSAGTSSSSRIPYSKMKGELEDEVKKIGFRHTVILRPGLLVGTRSESRPMESVLRGVAKGLAAMSPKLTDWWAQDVDLIGRAAVEAIMDCQDGKREEGVWVLEQSDIVRLGNRTSAS